MMPKKKKQFNEKSFRKWTLTFTKSTILLITVIWAVMTLYDAIMITTAIFQIGNFSYLDTFITELNETFRIIVGVNLVSKTIENVFRYNTFSGKSLHPADILTTNDEFL